MLMVSSVHEFVFIYIGMILIDLTIHIVPNASLGENDIIGQPKTAATKINPEIGESISKCIYSINFLLLKNLTADWLVLPIFARM